MSRGLSNEGSHNFYRKLWRESSAFCSDPSPTFRAKSSSTPREKASLRCHTKKYTLRFRVAWTVQLRQTGPVGPYWSVRVSGKSSGLVPKNEIEVEDVEAIE